jgi:hypothetical protein
MRALLISAALAALPSLAAAEEWHVVLGFFDHEPGGWDDAILDQGQQLEADLKACNLSPFWDWATKFDGYNDDGRGTVFIVYSPTSLTQSEAETMLDAAAPCVPEAYVQAMSYAGE